MAVCGADSPEMRIQSVLCVAFLGVVIFSEVGAPLVKLVSPHLNNLFVAVLAGSVSFSSDLEVMPADRGPFFPCNNFPCVYSEFGLPDLAYPLYLPRRSSVDAFYLANGRPRRVGLDPTHGLLSHLLVLFPRHCGDVLWSLLCTTRRPILGYNLVLKLLSSPLTSLTEACSAVPGKGG